MEVDELGVGKILDVSWIDVDFAGDFDEGWVLDRLEVAVQGIVNTGGIG